MDSIHIAINIAIEIELKYGKQSLHWIVHKAQVT